MQDSISLCFRVVNAKVLNCEIAGFKSLRSDHLLARVAQLVEHQIVDLRVAGSCPVSCPIFSEKKLANRAFFALCAVRRDGTANRRTAFGHGFSVQILLFGMVCGGLLSCAKSGDFLASSLRGKTRKRSGGSRLTSSPRGSCRGFRPSVVRSSHPVRPSAFRPSAPSSA